MGRLWIQTSKSTSPSSRTALVEMQIPVEKGPENPPQINAAEPRRGRIPMMFVKTARARSPRSREPHPGEDKGTGDERKMDKRPDGPRRARLASEMSPSRPEEDDEQHAIWKVSLRSCFGCCLYRCCHGNETLTATNNTDK